MIHPVICRYAAGLWKSLKKAQIAHIDALAGKYTGNFKYQYHQPGVKRIIYKIIPEKVDPHG